MTGELLLCQAEASGGWRQIGEEELQQAQVAQLRRLIVWPVEPSLQGVKAGLGDREHATTSSVLLGQLGDQPQAGQSRRLAVQEGVRERPKVAERGADVPLELVRRRRPLPREQAKDQV